MSELPFPSWLDNTALTDFRSCERKGYWSTFRLLEPKPSSVHLHAGAAFAHGLEAARIAFYLDKKSAEDAILDGIRALWTAYGDFECPERENKTWLGTTYALLHYFSKWPLDQDYLEPVIFGESRAIEFGFAVPLNIKHPQTGDPILYTGRADMFAKYHDSYWNVDDKTTKAIGPLWAEQWALRGQFIGYTWAARQYGFDVKGTVVRGVSIQATMNKDAEAIKPYSQHLIDCWLAATYRTIKDMIRSWEQNDFRQDFGHSCSSYGGCPNARLCESPDPDKWMGYYQQRKWDPLNKPDLS